MEKEFSRKEPLSPRGTDQNQSDTASAVGQSEGQGTCNRVCLGSCWGNPEPLSSGSDRLRCPWAASSAEVGTGAWARPVGRFWAAAGCGSFLCGVFSEQNKTKTEEAKGGLGNNVTCSEVKECFRVLCPLN